MNEKQEQMILTPVYSLLSLNVLCGTWGDPLPIPRLKSQINKIKHLQPDIVCLQEFNSYTVEHIYRKNLHTNYDFHVCYVPISEICRRMCICLSITLFLLCVNKYIYYLFMLILFHPYVFSFIIGHQKTGNAVMTHKSIRKQISNINCKEFTYQSGDFLNIMRRRGYIDIHVDDVVIRNTHLNHEDQNQNYHQMVECVSDVDSPTLLVGDFNSEVVLPILAHKFKDTTKYLGNTYRKNNKYTKYFAKSKRIDYIFSLDIPVFTADKLDFDSDHDALFIEFCSYKLDKNKLHNGTITAKKHHILATDLE